MSQPRNTIYSEHMQLVGQIKDERIQRLLQGTVPGERYRTVEFQQRTGWTSATTRVVIGYAMRLGLLRSEGPPGKTRFLRTNPRETQAGSLVERTTLEDYETTWRSFRSLCMETRRR